MTLAASYEDPDRLTGRCKKTGLLGRMCETAEIRVWETAEARPCHLASAARTAATRADPHAGKAQAAEGYHWAKASRRDEV